MEKKINSYIPIIEAWETFKNSHPKKDLLEFGYWLIDTQNIQKTVSREKSELDNYFNDNTLKYDYSFQNSEAAFLIWRLSKFIRFYVKPVIIENGLSSQDDFAILAHIDYLKTCSKKEAIEANIIDSTTGIEIIKRLVKQGLITEKENTNDKRQKLISLTKEGKKVLKNIYTGFSGIQDVLVNMADQEREFLVKILKSLDEFHTSNITEVKKQSHLSG